MREEEKSSSEGLAGSEEAVVGGAAWARKPSEDGVDERTVEEKLANEAVEKDFNKHKKRKGLFFW